MVFVTGRKARLRSASESFEQLLDQLAEAKARHDAVAEEMKAHFDSEVAALRQELTQAYAVMERLRTLKRLR